MKRVLFTTLVFVSLALFTVNAQTLPSNSAEVSDITTTSTTFVDVTGASASVSVTAGDKVMVVSSIIMNLTATGSEEAAYLLENVEDAAVSDTIARAVNEYPGAGSNVYVFTVGGTGTRTFKLKHKVSGGTLNTTASIAVVVLNDGTNTLQAEVQELATPVATSSTTFAEVTGSATTAITTTDAGGFVVMSSIQTVKTAGSSATGEWKLQYKVGVGAWTDLGYTIQRSTSGTGKGVVNLVGGLTSSTPAGTYYFRVMHRVTTDTGGEEVETQACNIIAASFANPTYMFQVFQGAKSSILTSSNSYSAAIEYPITTNAAVTPKLLMLGQFNIESNGVSNAPKFDFSVDDGSFYDGVDHLRYLSSHSDVGSAAVIGLTSAMTASTSYNLALRHSSNASNPIRRITTSNIMAIGVGLSDNAFVGYPVTVNSTLGVSYASYSTLKDAFDAINIGTHKGDITVNINSNITETASAVLYENKHNMGGGVKSSYTSIHIFPTGNDLSITGNFAGPLIDLNGADNVTIDGRVNLSGTINMTIEQQNTLSPTIRFLNSAENNFIQYAYIKGANASTSSGVLDFSTSSKGAGNDNNTIQNNKFTCSGSNKPTYTIFSLGSNGNLNDGNQILNNEFYDLFNTGPISNVIFVSSYSTEYTVSGNSFYETSTVTASQAGHYAFIHIENTAGNGFIASDNYMGGTAAQCGGTAMVLNSSYGTYFEAMDLHVGIAVASEINGNTIQNISYSSVYSDPFIGIELVSGNGNIGTTTGNTIGATSGTGSITVTNTSADCTTYGILISSVGDPVVSNNTIGAITTVGAASYSNSLVGIGTKPHYVSTTGNMTITNNIIGNTTANNMNASSASTSSTGQRVIGIENTNAGTIIISNNTVRNLKNAYAGTSNSARTGGIYSSGGDNTISYNIVSDIISASAQSGVVDSAAVCGIIQANTTASSSQDVSYNTVSALTNTEATAQVNAVGICFSAPSSGTQEVQSNLVYDISLSSSNTASKIGGIAMKDGVGDCYNNIIALGEDVTSGVMVIGINDQSNTGDNHNIYLNTVYIGGTVSAGVTGNSMALRRVFNNATSDYEANIFSNMRSGGTGGSHYAAYLAGTTGLTIDYNDYYAPSGVLANISGDIATLGAMQTATSQDANSVNTDPSYDNAGGSLPTDYYINAALWITNPTSVTLDYGQITRGAPTLIGALERHDYFWQGDISTDFGTAANWDINAVPLPGANIIFNPNPDRSCYLDVDRIVEDIDIDQNTDILVLNGNKLTITGDIIESTIDQIDADGAGDIVEFAGRAAQTFSSDVFISDTFDGLEVDNAFGVTLPQDITTGDLTLTNGAFIIDANTLTINDAITTTSGTLTGGATSNVVIGDAGTVASTALTPVSINNLTVNRGNGISLGGHVNIAGALTLTDGTITVGANTLNITGTSVARTSGDIDASHASATLAFNNTSSITLPASTFSADINNLTVNGGGIVAGDDITVNGVLNLQTNNPTVDVGLIDMGTDTLHYGANATTIGLGDVEGIVKRTSFAYDVDYTFGNEFNRMSFPNSALALPTAMYSEITLGLPAWESGAVLRVVDLVRVGGDVNLILQGKVHYTSGELNGNIENRLSIWNTSGPTDIGRTEVNVVDKWVGIGSIPLSYIGTTFGGGIGLDETGNAPITWDGSESTDWLDADNWDSGTVPTDTEDVIIPDAVTTPNDPTLPNDTTINTLTLEDGAILNGGTGTTLTIDGGAGALSVDNGMINPATSTIVFTNAVASIGGNIDLYNMTINSGAGLYLGTDSYLKISGTVTNSGTWTAATVQNTVEYNGAAQTVINPNATTTGYYNLVLSNDGVKTMPYSALDVYGDLFLNDSVSVTFSEAFDVDGDVYVDELSSLTSGSYASAIGGEFDLSGLCTITSGGSLTMDGTAKEIRVDQLGKLDVAGSFVSSANGFITLHAHDYTCGQILNNSGTITNTSAVVRYEIQMLQSTGWYFMSMPFEVASSEITYVTTGDTVALGGYYDTYVDIYVQSYDGFNRDDEGLPSSYSGNYWIDVPSKVLEQNKGYIIATERDHAYYFSSSAGETDLFSTTASEPVSKYVTNSDTTHHSWNLMGNPFSSGFDLIEASQDLAPFYVYNGYNYVAIMDGDNYKVYPFQAFFLQSFAGTSNTLDFATAGRQFRNASISESIEMDEIDLSIEGVDGRNDRFRVRLRDDASAGFNPGKDALKFKSLNWQVPQLYAESAGMSYAVHATAPVETGTMTIPLSMYVGVAGTYTITVADIANKVSRFKSVILKDNTTGSSTELLKDSVYTFTAAYGTTNTRMALMLEVDDVVTSLSVDGNAKNSILVKQNSGRITLENLEGEANVTIFDVTGKLIAEYDAVTNYQTLPISLKGVYVLEVSTKNQSEQFKLFVYEK